MRPPSLDALTMTTPVRNGIPETAGSTANRFSCASSSHAFLSPNSHLKMLRTVLLRIAEGYSSMRAFRLERGAAR